MSAFDYMWNAEQETQINKLRKEVAELKALVYNAHKWIQYLNNRIEVFENERTGLGVSATQTGRNTPPDSVT